MYYDCQLLYHNALRLPKWQLAFRNFFRGELIIRPVHCTILDEWTLRAQLIPAPGVVRKEYWPNTLTGVSPPIVTEDFLEITGVERIFAKVNYREVKQQWRLYPIPPKDMMAILEAIEKSRQLPTDGPPPLHK